MQRAEAIWAFAFIKPKHQTCKLSLNRISEASGPLLNSGYFIPLLDLVSELNVFSSRKVCSNDRNGYML